MVEIYLCILIVLHSNISVHCHRQIYTHPQNIFHDMQCLIVFCLVIANKIMPLKLHTANVWLDCLRNKKTDVNIKYNMGKYWSVCRVMYMCLRTIPHISFIPKSLYYNWSRYNCNCTWQRGGWWSYCHWQAL